MRCASCAAENPGGARYCSQCGAEQALPTPIAAVAAAVSGQRGHASAARAANAAQADLPDETRDGVYERMRSERQQVAGRIRAEGARDAEIIRATAQQEAQRLMGEGDAERSRIFASAYGRDPEFAAFYRSMRAYDTALEQGTPIVVPPDSDFFRYMQRRRGN